VFALKRKAQRVQRRYARSRNASLLEAVSLRRREDAIRLVFARLRASERIALAADAVEVGFRADTDLAGVA
jgi:hypothetical protein